ncbi:MAG: FxLD family lanthipeptide [Pseudonocardiaceae bacterium]
MARAIRWSHARQARLLTAVSGPGVRSDVSIVESDPVAAELMRLTDGGCGLTYTSRCNSC